MGSRAPTALGQNLATAGDLTSKAIDCGRDARTIEIEVPVRAGGSDDAATAGICLVAAIDGPHR